MIFFIIGVVAALVALAVLLLSEEGKAAAFIPGVVAVILIGVSCVSYVPTGYTGIVTTFGKVEDGTKDAGVVFKSPWQSIVKMDNRVQEMNMDQERRLLYWNSIGYLLCDRLPAPAEPQPNGCAAGNQRRYHDRKGGLQRF